MNEIKLNNNHSLGEGLPCFVLAEVGLNHNGDRVLADEQVAAAAEAGAHGVKFQNYLTDDFVSDKSQTYTYISQGNEVTESMYEMFKRYEIDRDFVHHVKETCDKHGVVFSSTPTSAAGIEDLVAVGTPVIKNGSDYLCNLDLIRQMGETGLPCIISCGMATLADVDRAVTAFKETGNENLVLLHCTSSYPTPVKDVHLRKVDTLREAFGLQVGFSDHTEGHIAACISAANGACMIEKHFTLDRNLPGPDHRFSSTPEELKELVKGVEDAVTMMGVSKLGPTDGEMVNLLEFRLSCVAARNLPANHTLMSSDIAFKRPGTGIPPFASEFLVGRRTTDSLKRDEMITKDSLVC